MIRAIIVDDEQHCLDRLTNLINDNFKNVLHIAATCLTVDESLHIIKTIQPQLIFLDVQIGDKTGFDLLMQLNEINFDVIFTTAYDKYAVQAFRFSAIDYLLKPVDPSDLKQAIEKLQNKLSAKETSEKLEILFHNLKTIQGASKKICVPVINGFVFLSISDIIRCESNINYTSIYLKDQQKLTVAKTLKDFEEMLSECNFYRIHNSHLINLSYIKSYNKGKGGFVTMTDNSEIEVSTRRKDDFLKTLSSM